MIFPPRHFLPASSEDPMVDSCHTTTTVDCVEASEEEAWAETDAAGDSEDWRVVVGKDAVPGVLVRMDSSTSGFQEWYRPIPSETRDLPN